MKVEKRERLSVKLLRALGKEKDKKLKGKDNNYESILFLKLRKPKIDLLFPLVFLT